MEEFENIKDFENYKINRDGVVLGLSGQELTKQLNVDGYPVVYLRRDGKNHCKRVHRLLMIQFVDNPNNFPVVNHIDGDKTNYSLENLEWTTVKGNAEHAREVLNVQHLPNVSVDDDTVHSICRLLQDGMDVKSICREIGVSKHVVHKINTKSNWTHISDKYCFDKRVGKILVEHIYQIVELVNQGYKSPAIVDFFNTPEITTDVVKRIASGKTYSEITKSILLPKEKRPSTIPRGSRIK